MELELIKKIDVATNTNLQFHRLMLLQNGTVVAFYSDDSEGCYYLNLYNSSGVEHIRLADFTYDVFDPPALFQFPGYLGIYLLPGICCICLRQRRELNLLRFPFPTPFRPFNIPDLKATDKLCLCGQY